MKNPDARMIFLPWLALMSACRALVGARSLAVRLLSG
jgi:hypothetical protein